MYPLGIVDMRRPVVGSVNQGMLTPFFNFISQLLSRPD